MRYLNDHKVNPANDKLELAVSGEPGSGGAYHDYVVMLPDGEEFSIRFQNGPIAENGVNGLTQEVLLSILIDRLRCFQSGPFSCRENAMALTKLEEAQMWLHRRTRERMARGVEGRHAP